MLKMIIADDEPVITAGIRKLVDWNAMGIEITGEYADGRAALEGIMTHKPDLALLDISMPGMTGVEILKECHLLGLAVQIILISGFQDFEYAKAGIHYGAVDYLLKPVIRDELLNAVGKSMSRLEQELALGQGEGGDGPGEDYSGLLPLEEGLYLPAYTELFLKEDEHPQMKKLVRFSVLSFLEEYLEKRNLGIVFTKNEHIVLVWKGLSREEGKEKAEKLVQKVRSQFGCGMGLIIGRTVEHMSEIPGAYQRCLCMREYFYFAGRLQCPVILEGEPVFTLPGGKEQLLRNRSQMIDMVVAQDEDNVRKSFDQFTKALCGMADGKKEDALFYLCSAVRMLEEKFRNLALPHPEYEEKELLQKGRACGDYEELCAAFYEIILEYVKNLKSSIVSNSNKDFLKAKAYIDKHYDENLTLEVLAGEVHMNPYYFSSFFKKNAGENFKDYLSRVRVQHAVSLLVSTDMKAYEIALQVGFGDTRGFSESFQRIYHETPASYRKRAKKETSFYVHPSD